MRIIATLLVLSAAIARSSWAQSLDIGGIELRLGQRPEDALRALASYTVNYSGDSWTVTQKSAGLYEVLGSFSATAGAISFISKSFRVPTNEESAGAYTRAAAELRRRGGTTCTTREVTYTDELIRAFETRCGRYQLSYSMPWKIPEGNVTTGVFLTVRSP